MACRHYISSRHTDFSRIAAKSSQTSKWAVMPRRFFKQRKMANDRRQGRRSRRKAGSTMAVNLKKKPRLGGRGGGN
jgi:hypothetical protein